MIIKKLLVENGLVYIHKNRKFSVIKKRKF